MKVYIRLSFVAGLASLLVSCKTQLLPSVQHQQHYQIDASIAADTTISNYYQPYKAQLEASMNEVIGHSKQHLEKSREPETMLGNFFVDAMLWQAKNIDPAVSLSFATKGGIRSDLKAGKVSIGSIFEMMPFENKISILTLKGSDIIRWADYMARTDGQPMAGVELTIRDKKVESLIYQGKAINPDAVYKMVTYDYLANGGDYVDFFDNIIERKDQDVLVRDALISYIKDLTQKGQDIEVKLDGRTRVSK